MKQSRYSEEVNRLLAKLDGYYQENTEPELETPIPDTQEPIQDVYIQYIFIEREEEEDEHDIIDSTLTEPDTNVPYAPTIQPLTNTQARDEKTSRHVGLCMMSLLLFLCLASIAFQLHLILNPPIATIILIPKSQTISLTATVQLGRVIPPTTLSQEKTVPTTGHGHQDAKAATGTVTVYNGSNTPQTVTAGTVFTGNDGIQVATDTDATIPAANPPLEGQATVPAHTLTANAKGNIQAYDTQALASSATQLLTAQAVKKLGTGYSLLGDVQVTTNAATVTGTHPTIAFSCTGVWVYALSNQAQEHIKDLIKGKTTQDAIHLLQTLPGIERVSTPWDVNTKLPKDTQNIHLVIFAGI